MEMHTYRRGISRIANLYAVINLPAIEKGRSCCHLIEEKPRPGVNINGKSTFFVSLHCQSIPVYQQIKKQ